MSDTPPPLPYAAPPLTPVVPAPADAVSTADAPRQLHAAQAAWRPIGRAVRYATFDAWTLAILAILSLPCAIGGVVGVLMALALGVLAYFEFRAVKRLKRLDPDAPRRLAVNQLVLAGAIVLYCVWNLALEATGHGISTQLKSYVPDLDSSDPQATDMVRTMVYALYATLAVVGGGIPVLTAWYHRSRTQLLQVYLAGTPAWILQMQRDHGHL
jgi:hypothetical protein